MLLCDEEWGAGVVVVLLIDGPLLRVSGGVVELLEVNISEADTLPVSCGGAAGGSGEELSIAPR